MVKNQESDELKALLEEVSQVEETKKQIVKPDEQIIDVLNLPPRREVHLSNSTKIKLKIKRPLVRFITSVIILGIIIALAYYYLGDDLFIFNYN